MGISEFNVIYVKCKLKCGQLAGETMIKKSIEGMVEEMGGRVDKNKV